WGYYMKWTGVDNMEKYWDYVIARYGAYPCTWTLAGEVTLAYYTDLGENWSYYKTQFREQWSEVARHIHHTDPYHRLVTVHPGPGVNDGKPPVNDMGTIDFVMLQSGHSGFRTLPHATMNVRKNLDDYPQKPILHGEVCFEGMHGEGSGSKVQRFLFWSNMLMGTAGFSYGAEGIWQFNTTTEKFGASPGGNTWGNVPWEVAYTYPGSREVGIGKTILEQYQWWDLKPAPDLISFSAPDSIFIPYCATTKNVRIIYMFDFPSSWRNIRCTKLNKEKTYQVTFIDPITGDTYPYGIISADVKGEWKVPKPPIMQDWVLVLKEKL
ncbi:MAG TPA: DUF4038 domain-containing protein, partial [Bacteroidales bacterium]|nr:DUF4038 domain-containing protein [Bacteroidales bacterium]